MSLSEKKFPFDFEPEFALHASDDRGSTEINEWCIDSGCSRHMTHVSGDLCQFQKFKCPVDVKLADKRVVPAIGFGCMNTTLFEESGKEVPIGSV